MVTKNNVTVYISRLSGDCREESADLTRAVLLRHFGFVPEIIRTENGKPVFLRNFGHLSISHSQNIFVLAFSEDENIGIDVEVPVGGRDYSRLIGRYGEEEFSKEDFLRLWTAKEACCKLTGEGIGGLKKISVRKDPFMAEIKGEKTVFLYDLSLAVGAPCTLAASGEVTWKVSDL